MFHNPSKQPYICAQCISKQLARQRRAYSSANSTLVPPAPPPSGAAKLITRRLIDISGSDAPKFLQGLVTNNVVPPPARQSGFYSAFLTAQGRVLNDVFIYPTLGTHWKHAAGKEEEEPGYLVDVDADSAVELMKHLGKHKLRARIQLRLLEEGEGEVWQVWREGERWTAHTQASGSSHGKELGWPRVQDCRAPGMGQRVLYLPAANGGAGRPREIEELDEAPLSAYTIRRYLQGVPEGQREIARDESLPMNYNIDLMGGIDFKKGCYVGQELTIRTHHTGVVRRRALPVALYESRQEPPEKLGYDCVLAEKVQRVLGGGEEQVDIRRDDKKKRATGKLIARIGNVGLGLCRLEQMSDLIISSEGSSFSPEDRFIVETADGSGAVGVKAFVPDWLRGRIREPKIQKRVE